MKDLSQTSSQKRAATLRHKMETAIREAIDRLINCKPRSAELKEQFKEMGFVPINQVTVCIEAKKSRSALHRHYQDLLHEIEAHADRKARGDADAVSRALGRATAEVSSLETALRALATRNAHLELRILALEQSLRHERAKVARLVDAASDRDGGRAIETSDN